MSWQPCQRRLNIGFPQKALKDKPHISHPTIHHPVVGGNCWAQLDSLEPKLGRDPEELIQLPFQSMKLARTFFADLKLHRSDNPAGLVIERQ